MLQCYGENGVTPYSLLIWARLTELKLVLLVATELWCDDIWSTFPYLYLDLAGEQLCFPPRKAINRRNESTEGTSFLFLWSTDDNIPVLLNVLDCIIYNCKIQYWFSLSTKIIKYYWLIITCPVEDDNSK